MWGVVLVMVTTLDSLQGLRYEVRPLANIQGFGVQLRLEKADRFGWFILYRRKPHERSWTEVSKVYVDRWRLPVDYCLQDKETGQVGWLYRLMWRSAGQPAQEVEIKTYWPFGKLPTPPEMSIENSASRTLRCAFSEAGQFLLRGYNSYGEEVFTISIETAGPQIERYQLPALRKGRYLLRLLDSTSLLSLAELVVSL